MSQCGPSKLDVPYTNKMDLQISQADSRKWNSEFKRYPKKDYFGGTEVFGSVESESGRFLFASAFNWTLGVFILPLFFSVFIGAIMACLDRAGRKLLDRIEDDNVLGMQLAKIDKRAGTTLLMVHPRILMEIVKNERKTRKSG